MSANDESQPPGERSRLAVDPELEAALREAEAAVDQAERRRDAADTAQVGAAPGPEPAPAAQEVEELSARLVEQRDQLVRLQADFDNFRKRALRERQEALQYGHQALVLDLLAVVDNLDRAIGHTRSAAQSGAESADLKALFEGVDLVRRQLLGALEKHGVGAVEALGKPFDPQFHEAMAQQPRSDVPPGTVLEVFQQGYRLRDRVVRPARVMVSRAPD
jgi:molecular chaperone GrpE